MRKPFPSQPTLCEDLVHVIGFELALQNARGAFGLLDADERARADRFREEHHRRAFVAAHAAMRIALGRCLQVPPVEIRYNYGPRGKPEIAAPQSTLRFNLSHAGDRALLAVTSGRAVGVDIERERDLEALDLARRFFSTAEQSALTSMPPDARLGAFFRCWTRKESFIKASGEGLSRSLAGFDMSPDDREPSVLLACRDAPDDVLRWTTIPLAVEHGYHAALTVEGRGWRLVEWSGL